MNYETQEEFEHYECGEETMIGEREVSEVEKIERACFIRLDNLLKNLRYED